MKPRFLRSRWMKPLLAIAALGIFFLVVELVFRIAGYQAEYLPQRVDNWEVDSSAVDEQGRFQSIPYGFIPNARIVSRYATNPRGYFDQDNAVVHQFNSVGWRDIEHNLQKPPNTFRVLGLGDSYLYGQGVHFSDICLKQLERRLVPLLPGRTIETINAGLSGYNTSQEKELLLNRGLQYDPDLIIVHFVLNDVEDANEKREDRLEFFERYVETLNQSDWLSQYSRFWGWARQTIIQQFRADSYIRRCSAGFRADSPQWQKCSAALLEIHEACKQRGIPLLVVIFPFYHSLNGDYPYQHVHDTVRSACQSNGIEVLDLRDAYRAFRGPELWVHRTDQHPNEEAHAIAARVMTDHLLTRPDYFLRSGATPKTQE